MVLFQSQLLKTDVTAVKIVGNHILAGVGNHLNVYEVCNKCTSTIQRLEIFDGNKIHGIEPDTECTRLILYGGSSINLSVCDSKEKHFRKCGTQNVGDWIWAAKWLRNGHIAVALMNNKLVVYDQNLVKLQEFTCSAKCILYSAFIINDSIEDLIILSGTVFSEIIVWKLTGANSPVLTTLKGHNGVIFSIDYNKCGYICSTSDDRSSIVWKVEDWTKITMQCRVYGHQSRVFRCKLLDSLFLTAGEDSLINIWDYDGNCVRKIESHQGGCIWSLDSDGSNIVSGGGDSGISSIPIERHLTLDELLVPDKGRPKRLGLMPNKVVLITENGLLFSIVDKHWNQVGRHDDLKSYNILEVSLCRRLVALAGYQGQIYIYKEVEDQLELLISYQTEHKTRIFSLHWLSCLSFLTCEDGGILTLYVLTEHSIQKISNFMLPWGKERRSSSACQVGPGRYVVGDRKGNLHLYSLEKNEPIITAKRVHNYLGVTRVLLHNDHVISLGRNSTIATFTDQLVPLHTDKVPFVWLANLNNNYLTAFSGSDFTIWDYSTRTTLLQHNCGGGHRSWDFHQEQNNTRFAYIKDDGVKIVSCDLDSFHPIEIVKGFHIREMNALKALSIEKGYILISGSEDTNLRISSIDHNNFTALTILKSHLSSIRTIVSCKIPNSNTYLVVSGGGRGQIICWKVSLDKNGVECSEEYSHYEKSLSETRIMDLVIQHKASEEWLLYAACSDGTVQVYRIQRLKAKFTLKLVTTIHYQHKCIIKLLLIELQNRYILVTMATDGNLVFWDVSNDENLENIAALKMVKTQQSGINSCSWLSISEDSFVLLSGGDDNALVFSLFKLEEDTLDVIATFKDCGTHCAQITGVFVAEKYLLTSSIDQKLAIFEWIWGEDGLICEKIGVYNSAIADIHGMECFDCGGWVDVILYGNGMEFVKCEKIKRHK